MSSDQRHNSHLPGMEENSDDLAAMLKKHGNNILLVILLIVMLLVSWTWLKNSKKVKDMERQQALSKVLISRGVSQSNSLSSSGDSLIGDTSYQPMSEISQLRELAAKEAGTNIGSNAMIQQADTIMTQLYFGKEYITADKKAEICSEAEEIFNSVISKYPKSATAVCQAKLGLAGIACEKKEWDKAIELYNSILAKKEGISSTVFPAMAQSGLDRIDDLKKIEDIEFPPAPEPEEDTAALETSGDEAADKSIEETVETEPAAEANVENQPAVEKTE